MGKRRRSRSPTAIAVKLEVQSPPKKKTKTLADVLQQPASSTNGIRNRHNSSSSSSSDYSSISKLNGNKYSLDNDESDQQQQFDVWLVRKPIDVSCQQLADAQLNFSIDNDSMMKQIIKIRDSTKNSRRRKLMCILNRDNQRQMIRVAIDNSSAQLNACGIINGVATISDYHTVDNSISDGGIFDVDNRDTEWFSRLDFRPIRREPNAPPSTVRLFQRTIPFGVGAKKKKKIKRERSVRKDRGDDYC